MRSEFQYFMNADDHAAFDEFLSSICDLNIKHGKSFDELMYLDGNIQYLRSELSDDILTAGRIAIFTTDSDGNHDVDHSRKTEKLYKKLRYWLKKRSKNTLSCFNEKIGDATTMPVNYLWIFSGAEAQVRANEFRLKQFKSGNTVFILE